MNRKLFLGLTIFALILMIGANVNQAKQVQAVATTGNLSAGTDAVFLNVVVTIKCFNLQMSERYSVEVNNVVTDAWRQDSTVTTKFLYKTFTSSQVSNGQINVTLIDFNSNASLINILDSILLESLGIDTFVNTNFIQELFPVLMLLGVMLLVISAILAGVVIRRRS